MSYSAPYGAAPYGGSQDSFDPVYTFPVTIEQRIYTPAQFSATIEQRIYTPLQFSVTIEQQIITIVPDGTVYAIIEQRVYTPVQFSVTVEQRIVQPLVVLSATIEQRIYTPLQLSATIEQQIHGSVSGVWSPVVVLAGVDISAQVTSEIAITYDEGASTIATLVYIPADGALDLLALVGAAVVIEYQDGNWKTREFTGIVSTPEYSPRLGQITLRCTTDMQSALATLPRAAINALIPTGQWSADIFDDDVGGWGYAQYLASTAPGSLWTDKNRVIRWTPWAAKTTPDITLTEADIIGGDVAIKHASRRDMIKRVLIDMDYTFYNLRTRQHSFALKYTGKFCEYMIRTFKLPSKEMVRSAAEGTGWQLDSIHYTELPGTQRFKCTAANGIGHYTHPFVATDDSRAHCLGASFTLSKRFAQQVRENYLIDVRADTDTALINQYAVAESYRVASEYDATAWEQEAPKILGYSQSAENPPPSSGALHLGGSGDYSEEADTARRAEFEAAQQVAMTKASTEIIATHRKSEVSFSVLMQPGIDLSKTIKIVTPQVTAQGKVKQIEERLSISTGQATSKITLAISRKAGTGIETGDTLDPVTRPDATAETPYQKLVWLGFRIGGVPATGGGTWSFGGAQGAAETDDDFNGYSTNYEDVDPEDSSLIFYSNRMTVITPEIEQAAVDAVTLAAEQTINVAVPADTLTLTK